MQGFYFYLNVDKKLWFIEVGYDGDPRYADGYQEHNKGSTHYQELSVRGFPSEAGPDVHGEDCRGRVEDGGQRWHQGCHHYS